ncbi:hypothetical protein F5Y15DRAFT_113620, partial [Xylariaceae sp. FL0016]
TGKDEKIKCVVFWVRQINPVYIHSICCFSAWTGWMTPVTYTVTSDSGDSATHEFRLSDRTTIILNVLETIEDTYRGSGSSDLFSRAIKEGQFANIEEFDLSLLTVQVDEDLGEVYGEDGIAVVDLDDNKLPGYLRVTFDVIRSWERYAPRKLTHKSPEKLLAHLKGEWTKDLKFLFE